MKKIVKIVLVSISLFVVSGCSKSEETPVSVKESSVESTTKTTTSSTKAEPTEEELFDKLSESEKLVLYADVVDSRVKKYPGLEGLELIYQLVDKDVYLQLTSGVGTGHPIYHLTIVDEGIKPVQGVSYMGIDGNEEVDVPDKVTTKKELYQTYKENESNIKLSTEKVTEDPHLKQVFEDKLKSAGVVETDEEVQEQKDAQGQKEATASLEPTDEEVLAYFKDYILDDLGQGSSFIKENTRYGADEEGGQMIRYGGGFGFYTKLEGTKIIYTGYSFGGVSENGEVAKSPTQNAFYDVATGEHGIQ